MPFININDVVFFAPNLGVWVERSSLDTPADELKVMIALAWSHINDFHLQDACCGCRGPLADYDEILYDEYVRLLEEIKIQENTKAIKKNLSALRRIEFQTARPQLVLKMIESGMNHVCSVPNCNQTENLTIDHVVPISRGGSDDLSNLRFLCRKHNSSKGDRLLPE